jgi:hypothetical protein
MIFIAIPIFQTVGSIALACGLNVDLFALAEDYEFAATFIILKRLDDIRLLFEVPFFSLPPF